MHSEWYDPGEVLPFVWGEWYEYTYIYGCGRRGHRFGFRRAVNGVLIVLHCKLDSHKGDLYVWEKGTNDSVYIAPWSLVFCFNPQKFWSVNIHEMNKVNRYIVENLFAIATQFKEQFKEPLPTT